MKFSETLKTKIAASTLVLGLVFGGASYYAPPTPAPGPSAAAKRQVSNQGAAQVKVVDGVQYVVIDGVEHRIVHRSERDVEGENLIRVDNLMALEGGEWVVFERLGTFGLKYSQVDGPPTQIRDV